MKLTSELFGAYLKCPTKCYLRSTGQTGSGNAYAEWVREQNDAYWKEGVQRLVAVAGDGVAATTPCAANLKTATWRLAVDLPWETETMASRLHAVEPAPSQGRGRLAQFIPVRFTFFNKLTKDDRLLAAFDALVLSEALRREVSMGKIIHGTDHTTLKVKVGSLLETVRKLAGKARELLASGSPPDLILNRHCGECEFRDGCRQKAVEKDDLSLLPGMSEKERMKYRSKGIFTVTQLSYTFRPRRRLKRLRDKRERYHHALKALAIREKKIHIVGSPELKIEGTPVYLDVEGLPDRDFYYLIGLRIDNAESAVQHSLWADTLEDEGKIWRHFLGILETVEKPVLVHYGSYETTFLKRMCERHGGLREGSTAVAALDSTVNLLSFIFAQIYFPTYSNSLKEVAGWLGFGWSRSDLSGLQAICWREDSKESNGYVFKRELINYNSDDCAALATVSKAISQATAPCKVELQGGVPCVRAESLKNDLANRYHEFVSQIPEFKKMTETAHWNCQRDQVRLARRKEKRHSAPQRKLSPPRIERDEFIDLSRRCPHCGGSACNKQRLRTRICHEMLFGRASLKVRRIRTVFQVYFCRTCRRHFGTLGHRRVCRKFGWNLRAFFIFLIIEVNIAQFTAVALLNRLFGIGADRTSLNTVKKHAAAYYADTYQMIKERMLNSHVLHVDETKANVQGRLAYVWVLTSLYEVIYLYSDTREGSMIQALLSSFNGVLVSDFYAVYEAIPCEQQKCLIHLIRDLNDDLLANPFDEELKHLAEWLGALMGPILETISRRGLKKHFLHKHLAFVWRFYRRLERDAFRSEAATRWQERLNRNKQTLFTFLKFDCVPWNNNNAEHAIKAFARLRNTIAGSSTIDGLGDYLALLSVCQTCKYMGVDFLDFLRSGEKDIHAFAESRRGRRRRQEAYQPRALPKEDSART